MSPSFLFIIQSLPPSQIPVAGDWVVNSPSFLSLMDQSLPEPPTQIPFLYSFSSLVIAKPPKLSKTCKTLKISHKLSKILINFKPQKKLLNPKTLNFLNFLTPKLSETLKDLQNLQNSQKLAKTLKTSYKFLNPQTLKLSKIL